MGGLIISSDEFLKLPKREQMKVLYENQVATFRLVEGYQTKQNVQKWNQRIQYLWLGILSCAAIFIIKQITKIV